MLDVTKHRRELKIRERSLMRTSIRTSASPTLTRAAIQVGCTVVSPPSARIPRFPGTHQRPEPPAHDETSVLVETPAVKALPIRSTHRFGFLGTGRDEAVVDLYCVPDAPGELLTKPLPSCPPVGEDTQSPSSHAAAAHK